VQQRRLLPTVGAVLLALAIAITIARSRKSA
jgi:hypothetical protein